MRKAHGVSVGYTLAQNYMEQALSDDNNSYEALYHLAILKMKDGDKTEEETLKTGFEMLLRVEKLSQDDPYYLANTYLILSMMCRDGIGTKSSKEKSEHYTNLANTMDVGYRTAWEKKTYLGTPYGNRTAGTGIQYIRIFSTDLNVDGYLNAYFTE